MKVNLSAGTTSHEPVVLFVDVVADLDGKPVGQLERSHFDVDGVFPAGEFSFGQRVVLGEIFNKSFSGNGLYLLDIKNDSAADILPGRYHLRITVAGTINRAEISMPEDRVEVNGSVLVTFDLAATLKGSS